MKMLVAMVLFAGFSVFADEADKARVELDKVRAAVEAGHFSEARKHAATVQAFYYRLPEAAAEALYYEALLDFKAGGSRAGVSALTELKACYSGSIWCLKARDELEKDAGE
ncbi:hypothetical protein [Tichowtungia aerotolerans]|uniref:Uncharacterized protein n=1 Tax=Tichowtungia aerotolerans TaxID=2697043 RepID=A0A6P1MDX9_9BACT|nr:hypothetical protein [Tichowtungia aerotolerans]QHI70764.1 hypothetical protein GT409_15390 [Tichowtungia aerotolerans]